MVTSTERAKRYVEAIHSSGLTIYDTINIGDPKLWIPAPELELLINESLRGIDLSGLPLRTRSKVVKSSVCQALGYPVPSSFKLTKPRFPGQHFDTYIQKANNLQVWNEELSATRRYVIVKVSEKNIVLKVKVVTGDTLAELDTTGKLTQKYQARLITGESSIELVSEKDTDFLLPFVTSNAAITSISNPTDYPTVGKLLSIRNIFDRLSRLVGTSFADAGSDQERNRGAELHRLVCKQLGYSEFNDDGQFPDIRHQLLEVKLQTSPTIDLGMVCPSSRAPLDIPRMADSQIRHCDTRYALFYAKTDGDLVTISHFFLTTGDCFFDRFPQFQGKVVNKKLQIPLPGWFFD